MPPPQTQTLPPAHLRVPSLMTKTRPRWSDTVCCIVDSFACASDLVKDKAGQPINRDDQTQLYDYITQRNELVHIWLGHSCTCIDVLDRLAVTGETGCEVEEFCNQVAAEALLPAKEVRAAWQPASKTAGRRAAERHTAGKSAGQTAKQLASLVAQFKVSRPVMAYRACSLKLLPWSALEELRQDSRFVNHRRSPASVLAWLQVVRRGQRQRSARPASALAGTQLVSWGC